MLDDALQYNLEFNVQQYDFLTGAFAILQWEKWLDVHNVIHNRPSSFVMLFSWGQEEPECVPESFPVEWQNTNEPADLTLPL